MINGMLDTELRYKKMTNHGTILILAQAMMTKVFHIIRVMILISLFSTLPKVHFIKKMLATIKEFTLNLSIMITNQRKYLQDSSMLKETFHWISLLEKITMKILIKYETALL